MSPKHVKYHKHSKVVSSKGFLSEQIDNTIGNGSNSVNNCNISGFFHKIGRLSKGRLDTKRTSGRFYLQSVPSQNTETSKGFKTKVQ